MLSLSRASDQSLFGELKSLAKINKQNFKQGCYFFLGFATVYLCFVLYKYSVEMLSFCS